MFSDAARDDIRSAVDADAFAFADAPNHRGAARAVSPSIVPLYLSVELQRYAPPRSTAGRPQMASRRCAGDGRALGRVRGARM
jgi:hypothetical protein